MIDGIEKMGMSIPIPLTANLGKILKTDCERKRYVPKGTWVSMFSNMKVGECIRFPGSDKRRGSSARVQSVSVARKTGFKFITRTIDGVLHVWRVA